MKKIIILCLICFNSFSFSAVSVDSLKNLNNSYNSLVASLVSLPVAQQIDSLESYISSHTVFKTIFYKLYERYQFAGDDTSYVHFLTRLSNRPALKKIAQYRLAWYYRQLGQYEKAEPHILQSLQCGEPDYFIIDNFATILYRTGKDSLIWDYINDDKISVCFRKLCEAMLADFAGDDSKALALFEEMEPWFHTLGFYYNSWGKILHGCGRFKEAEQVFLKSYNLLHETNDIDNAMWTATWLGYNATVMGEYERALTWYERANKAAIQLDYVQNIADIFERKIHVYFQRGDLENGLSDCQNFIDFSKKINDISLANLGYRKIGGILFNLKRFSEALEAYYQALQGSNQPNDFDELAILYNVLGECFYILHYPNVAFYFAQKAVDVVSHNPVSKAVLLNSKSNFALFPGDLPHMLNYKSDIDARAAYLRSLKHYYPLRYLYRLVAQNYYNAGLYKKTLEYLKEAWEIAELSGFAEGKNWVSLDLGKTYFQLEEYDKAIEQFNALIEFYDGKDYEQLKYESCGYRGLCYEKLGQTQQAISDYSKAVDYYERFRVKQTSGLARVGFFQNVVPFYQGLARCYAVEFQHTQNQSLLDSLYTVLENSKARSLKDFIHQEKQGSRTNDTAYINLTNQLQGLQKDLRKHAGTVHSDKEWDQIIAEMEAVRLMVMTERIKGSAGQSLKSEDHSHNTLADIQKAAAKHNRAILLYHTSEQSFVLACFPNRTVEVITLPASADSINGLVQQLVWPFHHLNSNKIDSVAFNAQSAFTLYEILVQPVLNKHSDVDKFFIVPDGGMFNLSFDMLLTQKPPKPVYYPVDPPDYKNDFLFKHIDMDVQPSTELLFHNKAQKTRGNMLVMANPHFEEREMGDTQLQLRARTGWSFSPLPAATAEGNDIKDMYDKADLFTREHASEKVLLENAGDYNMLHIATHAFVDTTSALFSGLVLASESQKTFDGFLQGYEIAEMDLKADLVVLSACETGRGKLVTGEGILGLPRIFISAGSNAVIQSLWKVDDNFTYRFFNEFYATYLNSQSTKNEALRQTKLHFLDSKKQNGLYNQHPYFWATFNLYGNGENPVKNHTKNYVILAGILGTAVIVFMMKRKRVL